MNKYFILSSIIFGLLLFGCKEEPSSVSQELQVDAVVEQMAGFGWEANQFVQTGSEIEEVTQESDILGGTDIEIPGGNISSKKKAINLFEQAQKELPKESELNKLVTDSLYIFFNDTIFNIINSLTLYILKSYLLIIYYTAIIHFGFITR